MEIKVANEGWVDEEGWHNATVLVDGVEYALVFALAMGYVDGEWFDENMPKHQA